MLMRGRIGGGAPAYEEEENANEGPLLEVQSPLCCVSTWAARRWPSTTNMNGPYAPPATPSGRRKRRRTWGRALPEEMQKAASRSSCGSTLIASQNGVRVISFVLMRIR